MKRFLPFLLILIMSCSPDKLEEPITLDELVIDVHGQSREIGYTNKEAGFFYTETNGEHRSSWQGWHSMSTKIMDDYKLILDGKELKKSDAPLAMVYPHQIRRGYKVGVQEGVTLLDSVDALVIQLDNVKGRSLQVLPLFSDSPDSSFYVTEWRNGVLLIAKKRHLQRTPDRNYPVWIGMTTVSRQSLSTPDSSVSLHGIRLAPASIRTSLDDSRLTIIFVAGDTKEQTIALARDIGARYPELIRARTLRMEGIINRSFVRTNNKRFDKALHWAILSMDALIMNQLRKGIFAGLPWFSNYWGRDSFISLPGATLVSGNFAEAKEILRSFAQWQETNPANPNFGRIPNTVTPTSIGYNTTDGTPWFVSALYEYVRYTNDTAFVAEMYPAVKRSIEGTLKHKADKNYFVTHEEAETWMDAVGPDGPWSPRGNRANDVQALWYNQLRIGSALATFMGEVKVAERWSQIAEKVSLAFDAHFVNHEKSFVYDHLNANGNRNPQFRPNQLFTANILRNPLHRFGMFKQVTEKLVFEHGVASLSQEDENFHPFHEYPPYFPKDAAYHNGIVWTWLAGPWIDLATHYAMPDLAYKVTDNMVSQILDRGAVGTISELLDAAPRPGEGEPHQSGTFTQAWSLAEFIRNFYQSYLGAQVDASGPQIDLNPRLPSALSQARFRVAVENFHLDITYRALRGKGEIIIHSPTGARQVYVKSSWPLAGRAQQHFETDISPGTTVKLSIDANRVIKETNEETSPLRSTKTHEPEQELFEEVKLASPFVRSDLKSLKGPNHPLLTNEDVKLRNANATVLVDVQDPDHDDVGTGSYTYPTTPYLEQGSLDLTRFNVSSDEANAYFRMNFSNLSNPGWHPQYGFQLTYVAIAIDKDGRTKSGRVAVGRNANISLPNGLGYETIIYVGGGIRVEHADGSVAAEYIPIPGDEKNPLGNHLTGTIEFSLPNSLIGTPESGWRFFVFVGAQDDHGGAGLGDFRTVEATAGEWVGGGKKRRNDSNVYDVLIAN